MKRRFLSTLLFSSHCVAQLLGEHSEEQKLLPARHWAVAIHDLQHILPSRSHSLYYAENGLAEPDSEHHYGVIDAKYNTPAVNLKHVDSINIAVSDGRASLSFGSQASFDAAHKSWTGHPSLLLLANASACGAASTVTDHCYLVGSDLDFSRKWPLTAAANVQRAEPNGLVEHASFEWGVYTPFSGAKYDNNEQVMDSGGIADLGSLKCDTSKFDHGLPSVSAGSDFNQRLDACKGYEAASKFPWYKYAETIGAVNPWRSDLVGTDNLQGDAADLDLNGADEIVKSFNKKHHQRRHASDSAWLDWVPSKFPGINHRVQENPGKGFSWAFPEDYGSDDSPWGKARLLWKKDEPGGSMSVYCVRCGARGRMAISGKGAWSRNRGLTQGQVTITNKMDVGLSVGVVASGNFTAGRNIPIAAHGFPCILFGIVAVGPMITLGLDVSAHSMGNGTMLAGARVVMSDAVAKLDFEDPLKTRVHGWVPEFVPEVSSTGGSVLKVQIGQPIGLAFGFSVLNGIYMRASGIIDRPALDVKAASSGAGSRAPVPDCSGISTQVSIQNEVYADVGSDKYSIQHPYSITLRKHCHGRRGMSQLESAVGWNRTDFNSVAPTEKTYARIVDSTGAYALAACPDHDLHLFPLSDASAISKNYCSQIFTVKNSVVGADGFGRLLGYDGDSMNALGVSRLRVYDSNAVPKGTVVVGLDGSDQAPGEREYYIARNSKGEVFYPTLCDYKDSKEQQARVFLVKNAETGASVLTSRAARDSVTGGKVEQCAVLPLMINTEDWNA